MSWRKNMLSGAFREAPFVVETGNLAGGRRVAMHEYPGRDTPFAEDMGRKGRQFSLEMLVLGSAYMAQRDALRAALEIEGPGDLVHPWIGRLKVQVTEFRLRESTREGGLARFSVTFVEVVDLPPPLKTETTTALSQAAKASKETAAEAFADGFSVTGHPSAFVAALQADIENALGGMSQTVQGLANEASALIRAPSNLLATIQGGSASIAAAATTPLAALRLLAATFGTAPETQAPSTTPARQQQSKAQEVLFNLVRAEALGTAAEQLAAWTPENKDQADELLQLLLGELADLQMQANDALYAALADLQFALVQDNRLRGANLARIVRSKLPASLPSLVASHLLHGSAKSEPELIKRNPQPYPGLIPGGATLETLEAANG